MQVKIQSVEINHESINPSLKIRVDIEYNDKLELPIYISGTIKVQSGKIISHLDEFQINANNELDLFVFQNEDEKSKTLRNTKQRNYYAYFIADLTSRAINYIEEMRENDTEKDVKLFFDFFIKTLEIPAVPNPQTRNYVTQAFLREKLRGDSQQFIIKHSDWINKYAPMLGLGNFILLDLQIPDESNVNEFWIELYGILSDNVKDMELTIRGGDWTKTMYYARKFYDNLRIGDGKNEHKKFEEELKILFEADQHDEESFKNFLDGIGNFFKFISKYAHDKDTKGKIKSRPIPTKEDAYFAYALAIGLLNIIGKKTSK
jgi:hypothetical protein